MKTRITKEEAEEILKTNPIFQWLAMLERGMCVKLQDFIRAEERSNKDAASSGDKRH